MLFFNNGFGRADIYAAAAFRAGFFIDNIYLFAFGYRIRRALVRASGTHGARVSYLICHYYLHEFSFPDF
jgi:hypothetical protein